MTASCKNDNSAEPPPTDSGPTPPAIGQEQLLEEISRQSSRVASRVGDSVVQIRATEISLDSQSQEDLKEFYEPIDESPAHRDGSGVVVTEDGFIITNYHVVVGTRQIEVTVADGRIYQAKTVGSDALTDLAVLKIDATSLSPIEWGDSSQLEVGEFVWAVGNPFGLGGSVSFGILSAKHRQGLTSSYLNAFLQTDAAINPGNSGGPLVNLNGKVIGINTANVGQSFQGISFAIPGNAARDVFQNIREQGKVTRGWIGVSLDKITPRRARELGMTTPRGVYVSALSHRSGPSPASQAGLRAGDVILVWADQPVDSPFELVRLIAHTQVDTVVKVSILRGGESRELSIPVVERP